jgi:hypothetical protein
MVWPNIFVQFAETGERHSQSLTPAREQCNECDLTAAPYFLLVDHNDWSSWFAISSLPPNCIASHSFMAVVGKKM